MYLNKYFLFFIEKFPNLPKPFSFLLFSFVLQKSIEKYLIIYNDLTSEFSFELLKTIQLCVLTVKMKCKIIAKYSVPANVVVSNKVVNVNGSAAEFL